MMPQTDDVTSFRLGQLEKGVDTLRSDLKEAIGTLGGGMTALQTQLHSYQSNVVDRFVSRREAEEKLDDIEERLRLLDARIDTLAQRSWMLVLALIAAGTSAAIAIINWVKP